MQHLIEVLKQLPNEIIQEVLSHATIPKEINVLLDASVRRCRNQCIDEVCSMSFSPDGKYICTGFYDGTVVLQSVDSDVPVRTWRHTKTVLSVAFSPNGRHLCTSAIDKNVILWSIGSDVPIRTWRHTNCVLSVAFSPDGKFVCTSSVGGTAKLGGTTKLWSVTTRELIHTWNHDDWVNSVAFSPNGKFVCTGSHKGTAKLWSIGYDKKLNPTSFNQVELLYAIAEAICSKGVVVADLKIFDTFMQLYPNIRTITRKFIYLEEFTPEEKETLRNRRMRLTE